MKKTFVIHPFLFAIFPVVFLYAHNMGQIFSATDILIPIVITTCFALLSLYLLGFVFKDKQKAGLLVSLGLLLFFSYGHFYDLIYFYFFDEMLATRFVVGGVEIGPNKVLFPMWVILLVLGAYFSIKTRRNLHNFTKTLNVVASSLILISLINVVGYELKTSSALSYNGSISNEQFNTPDSTQADMLPDIYYIILDSYAASSTLEGIFDYDNSEFTDHLTDKGFYVASKSRSNYASTELSISSSLNMEYLNNLSDKLGTESKDLSVLNQMIIDNRVMRFLKSKGYKFIHFSSGWGVTQYNPYANLEFRHRYANDFSVLILQTTVLRPVIKYFIQKDLRGAILYTFHKIAEIPDINEPTFVFAHILAPHELNSQEGGYVFGATYVGQFPVFNKELELLADAILSKSNVPPIIIFQADHGTAFTGGKFEQPTEKLIRERMSILNAYYLPADGKDFLYDSITPVNSFRLIFKHYFGANLDLLEDRNYFSDYDYRYKFTDVTDILVEEEGQNRNEI